MSKVSLKDFCVAFLLSIAAQCLKNKDLGNNNDPSPYLNVLEDVTFQEKDIVIIPESQDYFAFLNKESGELEMVVELGEDEKFLKEKCPTMLIANKKKRIKYFDCENKKLAINRFEDLEEIDEIIGH